MRYSSPTRQELLRAHYPRAPVASPGTGEDTTSESGHGEGHQHVSYRERRNAENVQNQVGQL